MAKKPKTKKPSRVLPKNAPTRLDRAVREGIKELKRLKEAAGIRKRKRILEEFNRPKNIPKRKRQSI